MFNVVLYKPQRGWEVGIAFALKIFAKTNGPPNYMAIFEYKKVKFKIDILGINAWRWTVLPRRQDELTLIGQVVGTEEIAIAHCQSEIDGLLERDDLR